MAIGSGTTASAVAGLPGGPVAPQGQPVADVAGDDSGPWASTTSTAQQRLAVLGDRLSRDRLDDALAVGRAALTAADATTALAGAAPQVDGLRTSVDALRAVVRTHEGTVVRARAGGGALLLPDATTAPPVLTPAQRLAAADEIARLAAQVFHVALQVEATAAASGGPGLPGVEGPALQLSMPRPLEALAPPADPASPTDPAAPTAAPTAGPGPAATPDATAAEGGAAVAAAEPGAAPAGAGTAASDPGADPAGAPPADPAADAPADAAAPDGARAPDAPADASAADVPAAALPAEVLDGLADLEAAVAAASGAASTELLTLEELPVLPSALAEVSAGRWSSFLPASWTGLGLENGRIPEALLCAPDFAPDFRLRCDAAAALEAVNEAYRTDFGEDLVVVSAYRTFEQQAGLRVAKGWLAAPAGRSNHGLGVAVDLGGFGALGSFDSPRYRWMLAHGERFGWVHPEVMRPGGGGPPEPWHFEFGTG
nr:M15 family metallopeptidase [uncultured Actinotalea sp.]